MIDPVVVAAVTLSGYRLVTSSAERRAPRQTARREKYDLVKRAKGLPAGTDIGEVRADGSSWWIRIPATTT
jgi:hypothetical protein